jgi:dihydrofolate reductase
MPHFDDVAGAEIDHLFQNCDLLLGRKTYEIFAGYWPHYDEKAPAGNIARMFNRIRKYVVSRSGDVIEVRHGPSAKLESAGRILPLAARRLHHPIDGDLCSDDDFSHRE